MTTTAYTTIGLGAGWLLLSFVAIIVSFFKGDTFRSEEKGSRWWFWDALAGAGFTILALDGELTGPSLWNIAEAGIAAIFWVIALGKFEFWWQTPKADIIYRVNIDVSADDLGATLDNLRKLTDNVPRVAHVAQK